MNGTMRRAAACLLVGTLVLAATGTSAAKGPPPSVIPPEQSGPDFGIVQIGSDSFYNWDFKTSDYAGAANRDFPVTIIFRGFASVNKVKEGLRPCFRTAIRTPRSSTRA